MGTRFWFSTASAPISPAFSSYWEGTNNVRRLLVNSPVSISNMRGQETLSAYEGSYSIYDALLCQFVSNPLPNDIIISGTVKGQAMVRESSSAADFCRAVVIKVVSNNGSVERGFLLVHFPSSLDSEFSTTFQNRYFPPESSLTPVECQAGDRIVVEIGFRSFNTVPTVYYGYFINGVTGFGDLPEDESETNTALNGWIEFSQDIWPSDSLVSGADIQVLGFDTRIASMDALVLSSNTRIASMDALVLSSNTRVISTDILVVSEPLWVDKGRRVFPLAPPKRLLQTQSGKRKFPLPGEQG